PAPVALVPSRMLQVVAIVARPRWPALAGCNGRAFAAWPTVLELFARPSIAALAVWRAERTTPRLPKASTLLAAVVAPRTRATGRAPAATGVLLRYRPELFIRWHPAFEVTEARVARRHRHHRFVEPGFAADDVDIAHLHWAHECDDHS